MNRMTRIFAITSLLLMGVNTAVACEYKAGETKFADYANCRFGEDSVQVVQLSEESMWENCVYHVQAFTPAKLLAVTKEQDGRETISINDRAKIGNPCYLTKQRCDAALKASLQ